MNRCAAMTPPALRCGSFVLLRSDALWLLLPQHEVGAVEYLEEPPIASFGQPGLHLLQRADGPRQLVALSSRMTPLEVFPADRTLVTALAGTPVLWCWSELRVLIDACLRPRALPRVLHGPEMPVHDFVEHDAGLAFVCDARTLCTHALGQGSTTPCA
jgi:hypothetical protein